MNSSVFLKRSTLKKSAYFFLALLCMYYATHRKFFFIEKCMGVITYPFLVIGNYAAKPFKPFFESRAQYRDLVNKVAELEFENKNLLDEIVKTKAEQTYFGRAHDAFEFQGRYNPMNGIGGKIIEKIITPQEHALFINKGSRDGVQNDMVAVFRTYLVGKVTDVYPYYSKIILLTDKTSKIAGYDATTNAQGIVVGNNNANSISFSFVSHLEPLHHNDLVLSSGQGMVFPEGFALGKIESYSTTDVCHTITLKPIIDFTKLEFCILLDRSLVKNF